MPYCASRRYSTLEGITSLEARTKYSAIIDIEQIERALDPHRLLHRRPRHGRGSRQASHRHSVTIQVKFVRNTTPKMAVFGFSWSAGDQGSFDDMAAKSDALFRKQRSGNHLMDCRRCWQRNRVLRDVGATCASVRLPVPRARNRVPAVPETVRLA